MTEPTKPPAARLPIRHPWLQVLVLFAVLLFAPGLMAQTGPDLIVSKAYFLDKTRSLTLEEVMAKPMTPYSGNLAKGYSRATLWIRISIDPETGDGAAGQPARALYRSVHGSSQDRSADLVLRVRPPYLDDIRLFDPLEPERGTRITGDASPWLTAEYRSLNHGFLIPRGNGARELWLRVESTSTLLVGVDVLPYDMMQALEHRQDLINNVDIVLILFLIVWGMLLFFNRPDAVVGAFLLVMVTSFFYASNYMGYYRIFLGEILPIGFSDAAHSMLILLLPATFLLFHRRLLADYQPKRWMMWLLLPGQYYVFIGLAALYLGYAAAALQINAILAGLSVAWICIILIAGIPAREAQAQADPLISKYWLLSYYLTLTAVYLVLILPAIGVVSAGDHSLYRSLVQGLMSFGALAGIVYVRSRLLERTRQRALVAAEQAAHFEKSKRQERDEFFAMLTHEIRTPLTVMAYAAETNLPKVELSQHVKAAVREIDQIIERCLQADRADQADLALSLEPCVVDVLIKDTLERFANDQIHVVNDATQNTLVTDRAIFQIVLGNLIDNAVKYSPKDSPIELCIKTQSRSDQSGLSIEVRNTPGAAGLPQDQRIFERYYRAPRARKTTGSGLGLYVAKSFAQRLGGDLRYINDNNQVVFELWIPTRTS